MRKIGVITDTHANLPALEAALAAIDAADCDAVIHTGDVLAIGPYPSECCDLLLNRPHTHLLMGNHDKYFAVGLPSPQPAWMSDEEYEHQQWTHAQLDDGLRDIVNFWPYEMTIPLGVAFARFCHYPRRDNEVDFVHIVKNPVAADLDEVFRGEGGVVFYGHHHPQSDLQGAARYINPGALGCNTVAEARFAILSIAEDGDWDVDLRAGPYDRDRLVRAYRERNVPAADSLLWTFHGLQP